MSRVPADETPSARDARLAKRRAYYVANKQKWAEYYREHAVERRAYVARWRLENPDKKYPNKNPAKRPTTDEEWEHERALRRESYARNREHNRAKSRAYAAAHKAEALERVKQWQAENPERRAAHRATRRSRRLGTFVELVHREVVYQMHGGRCGICGEFISGEFHVDHVIPLSRGGVHSYANSQPAHPTCNWRKGARLPSETEDLRHAA